MSPQAESATCKRGIEPNVFFLGWVSFLNDVASEMIAPLLPVFLTTVLGVSTTFLGLIEGIADSATSFLKLFSGWLSDRVRKARPFIFLGYLTACVSRPLMGLATAGWQALLIRFADRVGKGIRTAPRDALVANSAMPQERGKSFGFQRAMDHAGAVVGPLIGAVLFALSSHNFRFVFLLAIVPGILVLVLIQQKIKEPAPAPASVSAVNRELRQPFSPQKRFWYFMGCLFLFTLGNSSDAFLLLRTSQVGVAVVWIPLVWAFFHAVKSLVSTPAGRWSDRVGRKKIILAGWLLYAIVYLGFAFVRSVPQILALFALYGIYYGLTEGVERALVADFVGEEARGRAFGVYNFIIGLSVLPASLLMGFLWQAAGPTVAFLIGSALAFIAAVGFWVLV